MGVGKKSAHRYRLTIVQGSAHYGNRCTDSMGGGRHNPAFGISTSFYCILRNSGVIAMQLGAICLGVLDLADLLIFSYFCCRTGSSISHQALHVFGLKENEGLPGNRTEEVWRFIKKNRHKIPKSALLERMRLPGGKGVSGI